MIFDGFELTGLLDEASEKFDLLGNGKIALALAPTGHAARGRGKKPVGW